jgi:hypothetical protein
MQLESWLTDRVASELFFLIKVDSTALISRDCQHTKQIALNLDHCWKVAGHAGEYEASTCIICTLALRILLTTE